MEPDYTIRVAETADLGRLVDFTTREARETEGDDPDAAAVAVGVRTGLEGSAPATYWVAESRNGEVVGSISVVTEWSNFRGGYYWWVQSLFIVPEHRGSGLVELLLETIADAARAAGALDLRLYVLQSNQRAVAAYRRCGFEVAPYSIMTRHLNTPRGRVEG
jgi:ribosomal protein S18 acetylase RimI-like enzyme